jgi:predicted transcriptional regulator
MKPFETRKPPTVITLKRKKDTKSCQHKLDSADQACARDGIGQYLEDARPGRLRAARQCLADAVEKGIAAAERGEFIEEADLDARLEAMFRA